VTNWPVYFALERNEPYLRQDSLLLFSIPRRQNVPEIWWYGIRDDSCPMETDSTMSSQNQSGSVTLCDDTCGRDYHDRHFDRVMRLAGSDYNYQSRPCIKHVIFTWEIRKRNPFPPSLSFSLSLCLFLFFYRERNRNRILIDRAASLVRFFDMRKVVGGNNKFNTKEIRHQ